MSEICRVGAAQCTQMERRSHADRRQVECLGAMSRLALFRRLQHDRHLVGVSVPKKLDGDSITYRVMVQDGQ